MLMSSSSKAEWGLLKQRAKPSHPAGVKRLPCKLKYLTVVFAANESPRKVALSSSILVHSRESVSNAQVLSLKMAEKARHPVAVMLSSLSESNSNFLMALLFANESERMVNDSSLGMLLRRREEVILEAEWLSIAANSTYPFPSIWP